MKLSEAIRLGAMMRPQGKGNASMFAKSLGTCALGAALDAIGAIGMPGTEQDRYNFIKLQWPFTNVRMEVDGKKETVICHIFLMNDRGMTREQIAAWVATIEPAEDHDGRTISVADGSAGSHRGEHDQEESRACGAAAGKL